MNHGQYLHILLDGYANHRDFLIKYFTRMAKKANEKEFIDYEEFFSRCYNGIKSLENEIDQKRYKDLHKLDQYIHGLYNQMNDSNREELEVKIKETETIRDKTGGQFDRNSYSINLLQFTQNKFEGHLYLKDIDTIKIGLLGAIKRIEKELNLKNETPKKDPTQTPRYKEVKAIFDEYQFFDKIDDLAELNEEKQSKVIEWISSIPRGNKKEIAGFIREFGLDEIVLKKEEKFTNIKEARKKLGEIGIGCKATYMNGLNYEENEERKKARDYINSMK